MNKILLFASLFFLFTHTVQAQTREAFIEKLEAVNMDDNQGQLAVLDEALKIFPKDADLYGRRADLKTRMEAPFSKKDTYGFMADYTKALEIENVSWRYEARANAKSLLEDYKGALEDCNIAVTMAEKAGKKDLLFSAYHARSNAKAFSKDYKGAVKDIEAAIKYHTEPDGSFVAAMLNSASDYAMEAGDFQTAIQYLDRAAAIYKKLGDDTESLMYYKRGELNVEKLNKTAEGCEDFKKALSIKNGGIFQEGITKKMKKYCK